MQFLQCADLLAQFLAVADDVLRRQLDIEIALFLFLALDEPRDAIQSDTPIVADDAAAPVSVGEPRQDVRTATLSDVVSVGVEYGIIVRFAIFREGFDDARVWFIAVNSKSVHNHAQPAIRHDCALQRRIGLQAHDDFVLAVDIARTVRCDGARNLGDVEYAFLSFLHK